jgi:hypothetical protein
MAGNLENASRRSFVKVLSHSTIVIPILGLSACGKPQTSADAGAPPPPAPPPSGTSMDATAGEVANTAQPAASGTDLPHIGPDDPAARALGYSPDAATVDNAKYPEHLKGQMCRKCAQFKGAPTDAWGPCMVFAGKQVNAHGWCTAFVARPA